MDKNNDPIKTLIDENREQFDDIEPTAFLWNRIEDSLETGSPANTKKFVPWAVAASVALIFAAVFFLSSPDSDIMIAEETETIESPFLSGLAEIDHYYAVELSERTSELKEYVIDPELQEELDALTKEFETLKKDLSSGANPELIIEAMIDNYRLRISILEDLLEDLKREQKTAQSNDKLV